MIGHRSPISGVDVSAQGLTATAGYDNAIILWDDLGRPVARGNHDHLVNQCRFNPAGDRLVTASSDYSARIWEIPGLRLVSVLRGHDDDVEMASFSPDGTRVATASRDHRIGVFDVGGAGADPNGCKMTLSLRGHKSDVLSVEWSEDGATLFSSSDDGTVRRWCARDGTLLATIDLGTVEADTVVRGEGDTLYAGTDGGEIAIIRGSVVERIAAHASGVKRVIADRVSRRLITASYDRWVKLWRIDADGGLSLAAETQAPASVWLRSIAARADGRLVFGTFGTGYAVFDPAIGDWDLSRVQDTSGINAVRHHAGAVWTIGDAGVLRRDGVVVQRIGSLCNFLMPFGTMLLTGGHLGIVFDALTGTELHRHHSPLNCATVFVRGGVDHVAIGSYTGEALIFRQGARGMLDMAATIDVHANAIKGLASNGTELFSVCATGDAARVPIEALGPASIIAAAHSRICNGAAALNDGGFVSVGRDLQLRFWYPDRAWAIATPHRHSVKCVAACDASGRVATGTYDGEVGIYEPKTMTWTVARPTTAGISSIATCGEAGVFIAASYDGQTYRIDHPAQPAG